MISKMEEAVVNKSLWKDAKVFFFDLDGCIYRGETLNQGVVELLVALILIRRTKLSIIQNLA